MVSLYDGGTHYDGNDDHDSSSAAGWASWLSVLGKVAELCNFAWGEDLQKFHTPSADSSHAIG